MKAFSIRMASPSRYIAKTVRSRVVAYAHLTGTKRTLYQLECGHVVERAKTSRRGRSICDACTAKRAKRCAG